MYQRRLDETRRMTMANANAFGIAMGGDKAYQSWLAAQDEPDPQKSGAGSQAMAIARMRGLFARQGSTSPLRHAIRAKRPD
jgi:hypothetical protein